MAWSRFWGSAPGQVCSQQTGRSLAPAAMQLGGEEATSGDMPDASGETASPSGVTLSLSHPCKGWFKAPLF